MAQTHDSADDLPPSGVPSAADAGQIERRFRRWKVDFDGTYGSGSESVTCEICDLSPGGARVKIAGAPENTVGTRIVLDIPDYGPVDAEVRHVEDGVLGLSFRHAGSDELELASHLLLLKKTDQLFVGRGLPAVSDSAATGWLATIRLSLGGRANPAPPESELSNEIEQPADRDLGGPTMSKLDELELRAQSAAQSLADRQERELQLWTSLHALEDEVNELRQRCEQLEDETVSLRADKEQLAGELDQSREEIRQMLSDSKRSQAEFGPLQDELESVSRERDGLRSTLDALVTQIELNSDAAGDGTTKENAEMAHGA